MREESRTSASAVVRFRVSCLRYQCVDVLCDERYFEVYSVNTRATCRSKSDCLEMMIYGV
jgi:hypothetical protein